MIGIDEVIRKILERRATVAHTRSLLVGLSGIDGCGTAVRKETGFMNKQGRLWEIILSVGAPLVLAVVELFHPHPHDLLRLDVQTWLFVHYAQILLFPLSALAFATLLRGQRGVAATLCRICMFVFAVSYTAFDTAAGVVTGILVKAANASGTPEAWRTAIDAVWNDPVVGGSPLVPAPFLAVLGTIALPLGAVAAAVSFRRSGSSWFPVFLFALFSFGIFIFKTHAWPGGPLTFGGMALAGRWLLWEKAISDDRLRTG